MCVLASCMHCCAAKCARVVKCIFMIVLNLKKKNYWSSGVTARRSSRVIFFFFLGGGGGATGGLEDMCEGAKRPSGGGCGALLPR